jgi:hypothetical protein
MRITHSSGLLLIPATLLFLSGHILPAQTASQHPDAFTIKSWLSNSFSQKQCPSLPVNLFGSFEANPQVLRNRITISEKQLLINGTNDPDYIVISADSAPDYVRVSWNLIPLGQHHSEVPGQTRFRLS